MNRLLARLRHRLRTFFGLESLSAAITQTIAELKMVSGIRPHRPTYAYLGNHRGLVVLHDGSRIFVDTRDLSLAPSLIVYGYWERWIDIVVTRLTRPGAVAVDLGANFGYYTLAMARASGPTGRIYAFEANPDIASLLADTIVINGLDERVALQNVAIMDRCTPIELSVPSGHMGGGHIFSALVDSTHHRHAVEGLTLCDALPDVTRIDILRMDIEGCEPLALKGAEPLIRASPDLVIISEWRVEMMEFQCDVAEFVDWLGQLGFAFWEIRVDSTLEPVTPAGMLLLAPCDVVISRRRPF